MDRLMIVPVAAVADVIDLVERALPDLDRILADALHGAVAQLVSACILEPLVEPADAGHR